MIKKNLRSIKNYFIKRKNDFLGNKNYEKFVVITRSRTGSNLLISLLNSHPNIVAKGEKFSRLEGKNSNAVWDDIFCKMPKRIKIMGFKIFYYHPLDSDNNEVWNYLKNDKSIKIIHLTRSNMLRTVTSRQIAAKTDKWSKFNKKEVSIEEKRINLDIDYCLKEFENTFNFERKIRDEYNSERIIEITYEELIQDNQYILNQIFNFLGLENSKVASSHKKQNKEELRDLIINYEELVKDIENSKWSYLLELN